MTLPAEPAELLKRSCGGLGGLLMICCAAAPNHQSTMSQSPFEATVSASSQPSATKAVLAPSAAPTAGRYQTRPRCPASDSSNGPRLCELTIRQIDWQHRYLTRRAAADHVGVCLGTECVSKAVCVENCLKVGVSDILLMYGPDAALCGHAGTTPAQCREQASVPNAKALSAAEVLIKECMASCAVPQPQIDAPWID
ncbi:MAG: hypothetical protein RJA70_1091 [Pseudomonadota bacterium]|jgi:hypothetical protein